MNPEASQEAREALEPEARLVRSEDEIPIHGEAETLVEGADAIPHAATPEHGFLRDILHPLDGLRIVPR